MYSFNSTQIINFLLHSIKAQPNKIPIPLYLESISSAFTINEKTAKDLAVEMYKIIGDGLRPKLANIKAKIVADLEPLFEQNKPME